MGRGQAMNGIGEGEVGWNYVNVVLMKFSKN